MFEYLIIIEPLGLLYGSSGRFLSPENLVGRSGTKFPPTTATLSGLFAAHYGDLSPDKLDKLCLGGPFWANNENPQNFYVPTPFNCLVTPVPPSNKVKAGAIEYEIKYRQIWQDKDKQWQSWSYKEKKLGKSPVGKFASETWVSIEDWKKLQGNTKEKPKFYSSPWEFIPHLHPRLQADQRLVAPDIEKNQGSLFLENSVQLDPETCLIYLSNTEIDDGWYRFGGEGHMVNLKCKPLSGDGKDWLNKPLTQSFALITPAVWGSNRLSYREPMVKNGNTWEPIWYDKDATRSFLTRRPHPMRYRLGKRGVTSENGSNENSEDSNSQKLEKQPPRPLSRGRYAVPAGTVYVLAKPWENFLEKPDDIDDKWPTWNHWPESWFPTEGLSFKRWGCGLALPLEGAIYP